jgi:hypothetical protein
MPLALTGRDCNIKKITVFSHNCSPPNTHTPTIVAPQRHHTNSVAILDSGASGNYLDANAEPHCTNVCPTNHGPSVQVANGENIEATKRAIVPLAKELSTQAKLATFSKASNPAPSFPLANYAMTTASLSSPSTTSKATNKDKSSLSANATAPTACGTYRWHRKRRPPTQCPPPNPLTSPNIAPTAPSTTSAQSKTSPPSYMPAPSAQYRQHSYEPSNVATSTRGPASLLHSSPNTLRSHLPPASI